VALRAHAPIAAAAALAPEAPPSAAPWVARARRIASSTGGAYSDDGSTATVAFQGASHHPAPAGPVLARAADGMAVPRAAAPLAAHPPDPPPASASLDIEEVLEEVVSRVRRELLHDRERVGDLAGDLLGTGPPR
jgi:hypothetical protein